MLMTQCFTRLHEQLAGQKILASATEGEVLRLCSSLSGMALPDLPAASFVPRPDRITLTLPELYNCHSSLKHK